MQMLKEKNKEFLETELSPMPKNSKVDLIQVLQVSRIECA